MPVKSADRSRLSEMLDPVRNGAMTCNRAQPAQRCGMTVYHSDHRTIAWQLLQQPFHMAQRSGVSARAVPLRGAPPRMQSIGGGHGQYG